MGVELERGDRVFILVTTDIEGTMVTGKRHYSYIGKSAKEGFSIVEGENDVDVIRTERLYKYVKPLKL